MSVTVSTTSNSVTVTDQAALQGATVFAKQVYPHDPTFT